MKELGFFFPPLKKWGGGLYPRTLDLNPASLYPCQWDLFSLSELNCPTCKMGTLKVSFPPRAALGTTRDAVCKEPDPREVF